jgi:dihydropteroate synthase
MGIINVTPDSFSDGGEHYRLEDAHRSALEMVEHGADIIDIGGESSRPGSDRVSEEEELSRVLPVIESLTGRTDVPLSIDTRRASVARAAIDAGCSIVNDISACRDPGMSGIIRESEATIIIMHMKGEPKTMQSEPSYHDVVAEVASFLGERAQSLIADGVDPGKIVVDPGIGFGKRFQDNIELLRSINSIGRLGYPVMVGASRKTFIGEIVEAPPNGRLTGSLAVAAWCRSCNVDVVRVHDVKETSELFRVLDAVEPAKGPANNP